MAKTTKKTASGGRQAKIQAAAGSGGGGANRIVVAAAVVVVAIVAVVAGVVWTQVQREAEVGTSTATPAGAQMGEGYRAFADVELREGAPVVDVFEDFQCPACGQFEAAFGGPIEDLARDGRIELKYHILNFLDDTTGADYSTPAANGGFCAADQGAFQDFHDAAYAGQAREGVDLPQETLDGWAQEAGITGDDLDTWEQCVADGTYTRYVTSVNATAFEEEGVRGTPTVKSDGEEVDLSGVSTPEDLAEVLGATS